MEVETMEKGPQEWIIQVNDYRLSHQTLLQFHLIKEVYLNNLESNY